ncbi:MAG: DUF4832 domain-containing protein [Paludibacteraceae bacterium]|nr:DUF4832 domain-containing protein [Paludibacteraceae bacterium]
MIKTITFAGLLFLGLTLHGAPVPQDLDYTDALEKVENPGIGFYRTQGLHLKAEGNQPASTWGNISHLRMDISEFSDKAVLSVNEETGDTTFGVSRPLTQDALEAFEATLDAVRQRGKTAIVRFAYDPWFNGSTKCDPEQSVILGHLKQLGEVYARNTDVITFVELGMYGSWGEMHSSNVGSNENIAEALQTLLRCTPPEIKIGVRRPDIVAVWLGVNKGGNYSGFDIHSEAFLKALAAKGDTLLRVGMYNDGYLGSYSDLGTIGMGESGHQMTREMMVQWLETYSMHTPYGGELVANYNGDEPINTPAYLSQEGFRTHTSYLNYEWHQPTILGWKEITFEGDDPEYNGKNGYTYVENHLGYRFILRSATIDTDPTGENGIDVTLGIENVGFGNLTRKAIVSFLFKGETESHEVLPKNPIDPMAWLSRETTTLSMRLEIPQEMEEGTYELFIRISEYGDHKSDKNYHCIQFGNPSAQYNATLGANKIGRFVYKKAGENGLDDIAQGEEGTRLLDGALHLQKGEKATLYNLKGEKLGEWRAGSERSISLIPYQGQTIIADIRGGKEAKSLKIIVE